MIFFLNGKFHICTIQIAIFFFFLVNIIWQFTLNWEVGTGKDNLKELGQKKEEEQKCKINYIKRIQFKGFHESHYESKKWLWIL